MPLHQKLVWLLGDVHVLAVSNTSSWQWKKKKEMEGLDYMCSSGPIIHYFVTSAVGDVYSNPELTKGMQQPEHKALSAETVESHESHIYTISNYSTKPFPSAEMCISRLSNWAKKNNSSEHTKFDANRGLVYSNYCRFHKLTSKSSTKKVYENTPIVI